MKPRSRSGSIILSWLQSDHDPSEGAPLAFLAAAADAQLSWRRAVQVADWLFSLTIRPFPNWGWVLASGIVTILIAFYLWASLPVTAIWLLGVLVGIQLICEGAALGYLAWKVRAS